MAPGHAVGARRASTTAETPAAKLARLSAKLETLTAPENKRVRKRVLAAIGKINTAARAALSPRADDAAEPSAKRPRATASEQPRASPAAADAPLVSARPAPAATAAASATGRARVDNRHLNREIAALAKRKQLAGAEQLFARARAQGAADVHTYTNMLNAFVRCGQLARAEALLRGMQAGDGPAPNTVAYTVLLKGYAAAGQMGAASRLLAQMCAARTPDGSAAAPPNVRTASTLLRGCARAGAVRLAEGVVRSMEEEWGCAPDASCYEALALLLCQALRVRRVRALLSSLRARPELAHAPGGEEEGGVAAVHPCANPSILLALARAHALLRQWGQAAEALAECRAALESALDVSQLVRQREGGEQPGARRAAGKGAGAARRGTTSGEGGGEQGAAEQPPGSKGGGKRRSVHLSAQSIGAFLAHRRSEQLLELSALQALVDAEAAGGGAQHEGEEDAPSLADAFARLVVFPSPHDEEEDGGEEPHADGDAAQPSRVARPRALDAPSLSMLSARRAEGSFGLRAYAQHAAKQPGGQPAAETLAAVRARLLAACGRGAGAGSGGARGGVRLRLAALFDAALAGRVDGGSVAAPPAARPPRGSDGAAGRAGAGAAQPRVHVEVCCGAGEWVVEQALHDARTAAAAAQSGAEGRQSAASAVNWVALELRADRAYQAFARVALARARNCAVICGDAALIFAEHIEAASVDCVCINHPQPPEWSGGERDSQGDHLLQPAFLAHCHAALRPGGTLAIVTDNLRYGRSLALSLSADAFAAEPCRFEPVQLGGEGAGSAKGGANGSAPAAGAKLAPGEQGRVPLHEGTPPASCGYTVRASSYFDRLWANGKRTRRFFVAVRRAAPAL